MRKQFVLGLTLLLALATIVFAGEKPASKDYHRVHGDIASIDATAKTFTVKHGNDTSSFKTDENTKYVGHLNKTLNFSDLQVGDDVRVSFTEVGSDKTAARVDVVHGKNKM
ncbi:MAG: DUF5666 domain-containing protein [Thermoanaerobaculia bacterium]